MVLFKIRAIKFVHFPGRLIAYEWGGIALILLVFGYLHMGCSFGIVGHQCLKK